MEKVVNTFIFLLLLFVNVEIKAGSLSTADRLDIIDMMNKYGLAVDNKDYDLLASLFSDDVEARLIFDPTFFGGEDIIINGKEDYLAYIKEAGSLYRTSQHLIGNPLITIENELIKVRTNLNARGYYNDRVDHTVTLWGYYETYMKKEDNMWKIVKHTFFSIGAEE
tara:strand:- start:708 stop:1205 length:498 start_codon:yes stop_codon:yes gene_type:complete